MSFSVEMTPDQVSVDAGSTAPITVTIRNESSDADQFEVSLEGLDPEWTVVPVPIVGVSGGQSGVEKVFLKPPRVSESQAGDYPFVVRVRSMESGESKQLQGILEIRPFHYLTMEVSPKKGTISPTKAENVFEATIMNLGNSDNSLQLFGNDPEDALTYTFSSEQVNLGPGQTKSVEVTAIPVRSRKIGSARLHGFSIGARSLDHPGLAASSQAQLEERSLISPGSLTLLGFVIALFIGWFALLPKPPVMELLNVNPDEVFMGDSVTVRWRADNANRVQIRLGGRLVIDSPEPSGSDDIRVEESGVLEAIAVRDGKTSAPISANVTVKERPVVPDPEIESFNITPRTVNKGEKVKVTYRVSSSVTKLTLSPPGMILDPNIDTIHITADMVGSNPYNLVAENASGKTVRKTITVVVVDPTLPRIDEFKSTPEKIDGDAGSITLSWQTANAARIELSDGATTTEIAESSGVRALVVMKTTEFVLTVTDGQGRKASKRIRVEVKPVPTIDPGSTTGGNSPPVNTGGGGI